MRREPQLLEPEPVLPTASTQLAPPPPAQPDELILDELLVEDVSIDGMCGVY
jgi:mycofactocin precursor